MYSRQCAIGFGNILRPRCALLTKDGQNDMDNWMWTGKKDGLLGGFLRVVLMAVLMTVMTAPANAGSREQAKRIHERIAGVPPGDIVLGQMQNAIDGTEPTCSLYGSVTGPQCAAYIAMENHGFYNVTLKNFAAPWTNRDRSVFVPLNDYIATVIGMIRDDRAFNTLLSDDITYIGSPGTVTAPPSGGNNDHYQQLEDGNHYLKDVLEFAPQSSVPGNVPSPATAGVLTSRAAAEAFFIAGTNRAMFRFTMVNHYCGDMEQLHDPRMPPDRIRQDVSRSPGGDSRVFMKNCVGCHRGLDPLALGFA
jgi:hypothetical protein